MRDIKLYLDKSVAIILIIAVIAASCSLNTTGPDELSVSSLISSAGRAIDEQLDNIRDYVEDDLGVRGLLDSVDGYSIAEDTYYEENGREYLEFIITGKNFSTTDEVFSAAEGLAPAEEIEKVKEQVSEMEARVLSDVENYARILTESEKKEFYSDLSSLFIETSVLLVSALVYAYMPSTVIWGKITVAAAIATVTGFVAATLLSIIKYYKTDATVSETFSDWIESVTTEPAASLAIATSVFSLGTSLGRSATVSAIILGIFALVKIVDDVKDLLSKYDFSV